jgi:hypothetical protein
MIIMIMHVFVRVNQYRAMGAEMMDADAEEVHELRQWELERNSWMLLRDLFIARLNARELLAEQKKGEAELVYDGKDRQLVDTFQSQDPAVVEHVVWFPSECLFVPSCLCILIKFYFLTDHQRLARANRTSSGTRGSAKINIPLHHARTGGSAKQGHRIRFVPVPPRPGRKRTHREIMSRRRSQSGAESPAKRF